LWLVYKEGTAVHRKKDQRTAESVWNIQDAFNEAITELEAEGFDCRIVVVGDPFLIPPGSWRVAEVYRERLTRRWARHQVLFLSYLVTLGLIFVTVLVSKTAPTLSIWLERIYLFLGILAFSHSLSIPSILIAAQSERIDSVIESKRRQEGIAPRTDLGEGGLG
jgi:hypothetical protein